MRTDWLCTVVMLFGQAIRRWMTGRHARIVFGAMPNLF
jgi:hypothetical protein